MTAFELREYPAAVRELSAALEDPRGALSEARRKEVEQLLERANTFVGRYHVRLSPAGAQLLVDGLTVKFESDGTLLLALGRHQLEVQARGYVGEQRAVMVEGADGETIAFQLVPTTPRPGLGIALSPSSGPMLAPGPTLMSASPPAPAEMGTSVAARVFKRYRWTWTATAGAVALGGLGLGLQRRARAENSSIERICAMVVCNPGIIDRRENLSRWSAVSWGASAALVVTAVMLSFWERNAAVRRTRLAMHPASSQASMARER